MNTGNFQYGEPVRITRIGVYNGSRGVVTSYDPDLKTYRIELIGGIRLTLVLGEFKHYEDDKFTFRDYRYAADCGDTVLRYWAWTAQQHLHDADVRKT